MTSSNIFYVAVASRIDKPLAYTSDILPCAGNTISVGSLVRVPLGKRQATGVVISTHSNRPSELKEVRLRSIEQLLAEEYWLTKGLVKTLNWSAKYYHEGIGRVTSTLLPTALSGQQLKLLKPQTAWSIKETSSTESYLPRLKGAPRQQALFQWLLDNPNSTAKSLQAAGFDQSLLKKLQEKSVVVESDLDANDAEQPFEFEAIDVPRSLTFHQAAAIEKFRAGAKSKPFLLEGVTGSGKTEVYLQAAIPALQLGKQLLMLVPEIGLVNQTETFFRNRVNTPIHIYTSECTDTQKLSAWRAAKRGESAIFIGTRSAIFLPLANAGIVIVDEEHDLSYKQQEGFRYNARDLATVRSRELEVPLILGSATPSLESYSNVESNSYEKISLPNRIAEVSLPIVSLEKSQPGQSLSEKSIERITRELEAGSQVLVFVNRRGYAPRTQCANCGWLALCPNCDSALCQHLRPAGLICHHCNYRQPTPKNCAICESTHLAQLGTGTEQVERLLKDRFPSIDCFRIDRDSTSRKGSINRYLKQASSQHACVLVGTQMLAKGHHLPRLSLAVVCDLDQALFSHDFRAQEHLGQLITQVAGRTGRESKQGELILETAHLDHPFWSTLTNQNYTDFASELANGRRENLLPPFTYAASLRAESADFQQLAMVMDTARALCESDSAEISVVGPIPAVIERKSGRFRYQINLLCPNRIGLHQTLARLSSGLKEMNRVSKVRWGIDVDPQTYD